MPQYKVYLKERGFTDKIKFTGRIKYQKYTNKTLVLFEVEKTYTELERIKYKTVEKSKINFYTEKSFYLEEIPEEIIIDCNQ